jgi:hypothetical protein
MPGTVIDARGITLSAGVATFDEVLVKRFKDIAAKAAAGHEQIKSWRSAKRAWWSAPPPIGFPGCAATTTRCKSDPEHTL